MKWFNQFALLFAVLIITLFAACKKDDIKPDEGNTGYKQYGTPFSNVPANDDIIMYEVNLRAFSSNGNIKGVIDRLDELKDLGINVIWLMPIHPIGEINSVNSPYSVKNYKSVSSEYGSLLDLRKLTDEAHSRNMAVIIDWVANHTSWDNSWINNKSWYTQDASGNIISPAGTNWADVADLNFDNADMRLAMIDAMKYWVLEANIDGYRCDYADGIPADFWKQAFDTLAAIPNRDYVLLAEGNRADHFTSGFDLNFGFDFYGATKNVFNGQAATTLFTVHNNDYASIPAGKHKLRYSTNHDESAWDNTPMVLFNGKKGALAASVLSVYVGGVPMIYTGQEVGRVSTVPFFSKSPINWSENPDMLQAYKGFLNFYAQSDIAKRGTSTPYNHFNVACFKKTLNNESILILTNVRNSAVDFILPNELKNTTWTDALTNTPVSLGTEIQLDNYQYLILKQ